MFRLLACSLVLAALGSASSPLRAEESLSTVRYDVEAFAGKEVAGIGKARGNGVEGLVRLLVNTVEPKSWRKPDHFIHEVNGNQLEIRTTDDVHKQIDDLLTALRRQLDVSVVMEAGLYEVERTYYEKKIAPQLARSRSLPLVLDEEQEKLLRQAARVATSGKVRLHDSRTQTVLSLRRAIAYEWLPRGGTDRLNEVAFVGVRLQTEARVSANRTAVRMQITQRGAELLAMRKENTHDARGQAVVLEVPDIRKSSTTTALTVGDCVLVVLPPAVPPPGFKGKDRVPLLFLRPYISIGNEERELNNRNGK